jgi:hypothetical protein
MPTKIRRKPTGTKQPAVGETDVEFLCAGRVNLDSGAAMDTFCGIGHPRNREMAREVWGGVSAGLMKQWARAYPGRRPWAWWAFDAPKSRMVINPGAAPISAASWHSWRESFGMPLAMSDSPGALIESEAAYLRRLDLLGVRELKALAATPGAFEPDRIPGEARSGGSLAPAAREVSQGDDAQGPAKEGAA